jgi:hypothetical protein
MMYKIVNNPKPNMHKCLDMGPKYAWTFKPKVNIPELLNLVLLNLGSIGVAENPL